MWSVRLGSSLGKLVVTGNGNWLYCDVISGHMTSDFGHIKLSKRRHYCFLCGCFHFCQQHKRWRDTNMRIIDQWIFSIHNKRYTDLLLKFNEQMKFAVFLWRQGKTRVSWICGSAGERYWLGIFWLRYWTSCCWERFLIFLWIYWLESFSKRFKLKNKRRILKKFENKKFHFMCV